MDHKSDNIVSKRKLLFLSRLASPHVGGVERHIDEISQELVKRGYEITLITQQHDESLSLEEKTRLYRCIRIPKRLQSKAQIWFWMLCHAHLVLTSDIIHAHDVFWWVLPLRFLCPWKKYFVTFHGYEGSEPPTQKAIRSRALTEKLTRGNICIGDWMRKWYGTKPDFVTYGAARVLRAKPVDTKNAISFGRLSADTGILEYIQAVKLLHGKISLDIYGEGELLTKVQGEIKGLDYIHYKGLANDATTLLSKYRFAFVSRYLSMIEAMQIGRYVFAQWNNPIKRDYLESFPSIGAATMFSLPEELAQELGYLLAHPMKEENAIALAESWARQQTWDKVATIYEELWKK
ncbi:MAG TPA: glycosyltransferase family 4 protein [Candidatus Saccharimonadia bacterium]|nr:glycosyltransferase family 4 protein [Candidatus Saccharimonadia bacterium]